AEEGREIEIGRMQIGPDGLPIFFDKEGQPIKILKNRDGTPRLFDRSGKVIDLAMPLRYITVANGRPYLLDRAGNAIIAEPGQADGETHVLMTARDNKLVYYKVHVNDVYAHFLTGTKKKEITPLPTMFPTGDAELEAIKRYAAGHDISFPDETALVVE